MKINLKPTVEMTEEQMETLRAFATDLTEACHNIASCEVCPLCSVRDDYLGDTCPDFIQSMLRGLGIS